MSDSVPYNSLLPNRETETGFRNRGALQGVALSDLVWLEYLNNKTIQPKRDLIKHMLPVMTSQRIKQLTLIKGTVLMQRMRQTA